ncbi:hypothetical protein EYZ11_006592 [Aspergillus tanneri]|uniref:Uncharacterized protein n=1 Tax=Aspergillus tanneri TaxID=1220188 RepID=A0A4S3JFN0_9EURO|nr:uncharacterized protein ATNIH1004_008190 [Aspergillus tanneri]KAA8643994.1 hypothetical protein ATNIH1004_008190 [Aspergillus tanneri]THC93945.1 hypothetical protein EYZ11_006592 [Aspergillus tanneri]
MPSQPLRTAIIGLSASATTSWAADAHLPALLSSRGKDLFKVTALCNSSVAAADSAIETYNLGATAKAYGNPTDLAADPAVDLVLCSTRVDKHYDTILPAVQAGKSAFVEWPIGANLSEAEELAKAAKIADSCSHGDGTLRAQVAVGLQGRFAPPVMRVKETLQSGRLGKLLSTELRAFGGTRDREILPTGLKYFAQKEVGGNPITIGFGHVIDWVQSVVGDIIPGTDHVHFQIQRPDIRVKDSKTGTFVESFQSDVPDLLSLHGSLPQSPHVTAHASLIAYFARGQPYPGDPSLTWTLTCELGTIRLTAPAGMSLQADAYAGPVTITVHRFDTDEVEQVQWTWSDAQLELPVRARSVLTCLVSLAEGNEDGYVSLEDGVRRARQIARWLDSAPASVF